jgi:hypothetical protein
MSYLELYCRADGSNLNAGGSNAAAALAEFANGGWNSATGVFTPASGNPVAAGVAAGMLASIYADGAAGPTGFVGRITAVTTTTFTVSTTAKAGTAPTTAGAAITARVGGAWLAPAGAVTFPANFVANTLVDAAGNFARVNLPAATMAITATFAHSISGPVRYEGMTATPGDGGVATFDGGTAGASFALASFTGANTELVNLRFQHNGATGTAGGVVLGGNNSAARRCVFSNVRGTGVSTGANTAFVECEAFDCNQSNSGFGAGFANSGGVVTYRRCISHDHAGNSSSGFYSTNTSHYLECIADSCGGQGFFTNNPGTLQFSLVNCDSYNNGGAGVLLWAAGGFVMFNAENCNVAKNAGWGLDSTVSAGGFIFGRMSHVRFGAGTMANAGGTVNGYGQVEQLNVASYAADASPWQDAPNGDFRVALAAAKGAGRATFLQTQAGYAGTAGYRDIGAAQHADAAGGGGAVVFPSGGYTGIWRS